MTLDEKFIKIVASDLRELTEALLLFVILLMANCMFTQTPPPKASNNQGKTIWTFLTNKQTKKRGKVSYT